MAPPGCSSVREVITRSTYHGYSHLWRHVGVPRLSLTTAWRGYIRERCLDPSSRDASAIASMSAEVTNMNNRAAGAGGSNNSPQTTTLPHVTPSAYSEHRALLPSSMHHPHRATR